MLLAEAAGSGGESHVPSLIWVAPFAALLLCIALLPLIPKTEHWWHQNKNKLLIAIVLGIITLGYYHTRDTGVHIHDPWVGGVMHDAGLEVHRHDGAWETETGLAATVGSLSNALMEYIPFISLLFSLYVISGGISVTGDIPAHPWTNVTFLAIGGALASFIGTTGASMLLIRPLLKTNSERKHVVHTVIFFIFLVSNVGGSLLPIGDPPLFLGYLKGVPFLWTLNLWKEWALVSIILLVIYFFWDCRAYKKEVPRDIALDETQIQKLKVAGKINFLLLAGVVFATGTLAPGKEFLNTGWEPFTFFREMVQIGMVLLSLALTPGALRKENNFNYGAILEVAALFIGIFICMQVPIEILHVKGPQLGIDTPSKFFWATGVLSSFLDNAPTYVVFFETAKTLAIPAGVEAVAGVAPQFLVPISIGAVFMGANTYIGNGPNFMVKSIAEHEGVKMPSFFGYMAYSGCVLIPIFILVTFIFLR